MTRILSLQPRGAAVLLALALPAGAQAQKIEIVGSTVDVETSEPIPAVEVTAFTHDWRRLDTAVTDSSGQFRLLLDSAEGYRFRTARLGYRPIESPILWVEDNRRVIVKLHLDPDVIVLAPLEVVARSRSIPNAGLRDFRARREAGLGHFITREEIEQRQPGRITDVLLSVPGLHVTHSTRTGRTIRMSRSMGKTNCPVQIYVDGFLMNRRTGPGRRAADWSLDEVVSPDDVEGIEVYRGLSSVPAEFLNADAQCGVVAVWTRRR